jgi:hypothetical protein
MSRGISIAPESSGSGAAFEIVAERQRERKIID